MKIEQHMKMTKRGLAEELIRRDSNMMEEHDLSLPVDGRFSGFGRHFRAAAMSRSCV